MKFNARKVLFAALFLAGTQSALAADLGTDAGTSIVNNATVSFDVGGVTQSTTPTGSATFVVDRKVNVVVAKVADNLTVAPGQTGRMLTYTVQNTSNDTLDFKLAASDGGGDFDATNLKIFVDEGNDTWDGTETEVSYIDDLGEDETVTVFVFGDIPLSATNGQSQTIWLAATAAEATGSAGTPGANLAETAGADDPNQVDNVFADGDGPADGDQDGVHSAAAMYQVATTTVAVTKSYTVVCENWNAAGGTCTGNFSAAGQLKPIPGALVEYCILVENNSATVDTTNIAINDPLSAPNTVAANVTWVQDSIRIGATCADYATGSTEDDDAVGADDTDGAAGSYASDTVSSVVNNLAAGSSTATMFRVIID